MTPPLCLLWWWGLRDSHPIPSLAWKGMTFILLPIAKNRGGVTRDLIDHIWMVHIWSTASLVDPAPLFTSAVGSPEMLFGYGSGPVSGGVFLFMWVGSCHSLWLRGRTSLDVMTMEGIYAAFFFFFWHGVAFKINTRPKGPNMDGGGTPMLFFLFNIQAFVYSLLSAVNPWLTAGMSHWFARTLVLS